MKLTPQTHGPVKLAKIDYAANLSQETFAFTAEVSIDGMKSEVSNEGMGGPNNIYDRKTDEAVEAYAKTLPAEEYEGMTIEQTGDYLISHMVGQALIANDLKKDLRKNIVYQKENGDIYVTKIKKGLEAKQKMALELKYGAQLFLNDLPFDEALVIYKEHTA